MARRDRRILRRQGKKYKPDAVAEHKNDTKDAPVAEVVHAKKKVNKFLSFYDRNYRKNMLNI